MTVQTRAFNDERLPLLALLSLCTLAAILWWPIGSRMAGATRSS